MVVHTDVPQSGTFTCSDEQINRLHELAVRTLLSNIHGLPTDCPHRERCGWLGDAHTAAPFSIHNYDMENFWLKYMEDVTSGANIHLENTLFHKLHNSEFYFTEKIPGIPFMIAPGRRQCGVASPDWGTAQVQIPWFIYQYYGNKEALEKHYDYMKVWTDHISGLSEDYIVPFGLGDWCPPGGNRTIDCPIQLSSTAFHYQDVSIMEKVARLLGKTADADAYAALKDKVGAALVAKYYDPSAKTFGSQTADVMALDFGFVPAGDEKAVSDAVARNVKEKYDGFLHTGIFGLGRIGSGLSRNGNAQAAWDIFTKKGNNSFEWMWKVCDATTLWEALPIDEATTKVGKGSSLNHPMQGGYDAWFYEDIAGIRPEAPGYKVIRFEPNQTAQLEWADASMGSPYGTIKSGWKKQADGKLDWEIVIPGNASGLVALPDGKTVTVNGKAFDAARYTAQGKSGASTLYNFPSGTFKISIQ